MNSYKKLMFDRFRNTYHFYVLVILCIVFVCIKIPSLKLPFFWDEAWVYAPGIKAMAEKGISLLPSGLSDSFSRGHPLLFFFTGAIWIKFFGASCFSIHSFALTISIAFIFSLFYVVKKIFSASLALIVSVIMLVQPIFIAQAAITLPEIFLCLWAILAIYHFVKKNWYYYFLFGTLMVLTKESGVVIIASIMLYQAVSLFTQKVTFQSFWKFFVDSLLAFIPIIPFLIFLVIQHYQRGYYFFPEHIALLSFNWQNFQETLKHCYDYVFERQGRIFTTFSFLVIFGVFYRYIPLGIRVFIVLGLIACVKIFFRYWALPDWLMILFIGLFASIFYYIMHIKYPAGSMETNKFLAIIFIIGIGYFIFSSVNFLTARYLFLLVPLMILYFSYYVNLSFSSLPFIYYCWSILIMSVSIYFSIFHSTDRGDDSPHYVDCIKLEQNIVDYLEQEKLQKSKIYCDFTMIIALHDKGIGFLTDTIKFSDVNGQFDKYKEYVIYTNVDYDTLWLHGSDTLPHFQIVKRFNYGVANGKLFKRILQTNTQHDE